MHIIEKVTTLLNDDLAFCVLHLSLPNKHGWDDNRCI